MRRKKFEESQAVQGWLEDRFGEGASNLFLWLPVLVIAGMFLWEIDFFETLRRGGSADAEIREHMRGSFLRTCAEDFEITANCQSLVDRHDPLCRWSKDAEAYYVCVRKSEDPHWEPPKDP